MSKRARRLWLGDWQRDQAAEPVQEDTVTILPDEEEALPPQNEQRRNRRRVIATAAAVTVLAALALTLINGGDDNKSRTTAEQTPPAQTFQAQPQVPQPQQVPPGAGGCFGGADLTGPAATKAAEAALSRFPGDIERVTAGPGGTGGYVVHVIQGDGNEVHVVVSDEFKVLGSDAGRGGPGFGGGAPPSGSGNSS